MFSNAGTKRSREIDNDGADHVLKKAKFDNAEIYDLPEEVLMHILVRVPKKNLGIIREVSKLWHQIAQKRDFWKLSCQRKWFTMVASDSLDFDQEEYFIPILNVNGKKLVDWKFYYTLRNKFYKLGKRLAPILISVGEQDTAEIFTNSSELHISAVNKCLEFVTFLSIDVGFEEEITQAFDFLCDLALLHYNRDDKEWFNPIADLMDLLSDRKALKPGQFGLCKRVFELSKLVLEENHMRFRGLFLIATRVLHSFSSIEDPQLQKLIKMMAEFMVHLGSVDFGQSEIGSTPKFQFPLPNGDVILLNKKLAKNKPILNMVFDILTQAYRESDDWRIKASAVCVGWVPSVSSRNYLRSYCDFAITAAENDDLKIAFAGMVGLHNLIAEYEVKAPYDNEDQLKKMFELFVSSLTRFSEELRVFFFDDLLLLLQDIRSESVIDDSLDRFIANVVSVFPLIEFSVNRLNLFSTIGKAFQSRLSSKLPLLKELFFGLIQTKNVQPEEVLKAYIKLGTEVKGAEFADEFRSIAKQIVEGTLPFEVSLIRCYSLFVETWIQFAESEEEKNDIATRLLVAIPAEVYEFGQSEPMKTQHLAGPADYPVTFNELLKRHGSDGGAKQAPVKSKPPRFAAKEHLKPVNPKGIIDQDNGHALRDEIIATNSYAIQLFRIVAEESRILQHCAQDLLHALLAGYRVMGSPALCRAVLSLLAYVKVEMDAADVYKYGEIMLHTTPRTVLQLNDMTTYLAWLPVLSDAFVACYDALESAPSVVHSNAIGDLLTFYLLLYDWPVRKLADVAGMMHNFITMWPRNAYEGIKESILAVWLRKRIKKASCLTELTPFLLVFSTTGALYGIDYVIDNLCKDDPEADTYEAPEDYLARIIPHCRELYNAVQKGDANAELLEANLLRNFIILHAIHAVDDYFGDIGMIPTLYDFDVERLKAALANDKLDTGIPELSKLVKAADFEKICKVLLLSRQLHENDEEEEECISGEESEEDVEVLEDNNKHSERKPKEPASI